MRVDLFGGLARLAERAAVHFTTSMRKDVTERTQGDLRVCRNKGRLKRFLTREDSRDL